MWHGSASTHRPPPPPPPQPNPAVAGVRPIEKVTQVGNSRLGLGEGRKARPYGYRHDPAVPKFPDERPIIIFDGYCAMCSGFARFVLRHDRRGLFRLVPAQSALGRALYVHYGLDPVDYETNILLENGVAWFKAEGSIRTAERLGLPWRLAAAARLLPRAWREALYDAVARNRLRIFGKREVCYVSDPQYADRFLA
jgi:predicted DCC family thiol-disulfide oxidoreductase YuxK